jgi:hypothetical protein
MGAAQRCASRRCATRLLAPAAGPKAAALLAVALALFATQAAAEAPAQRIFDTASFPNTADDRPPLWPFRKMGDATVSCSLNGLGVLRLTVQHQRFNGVKPPMMLWLMESLESGIAVSPQPRGAASVRLRVWGRRAGSGHARAQARGHSPTRCPARSLHLAI